MVYSALPEVEKQTKHGRPVQVSKHIEMLRPTHCLCMSCARLIPGELKNCSIAQGLYNVCAGNDVALAVTRCPHYVDKNF